MTHFSIEPQDWMFEKGCRFLSFAKDMSRNYGKNIKKNVSTIIEIRF